MHVCAQLRRRTLHQALATAAAPAAWSGSRGRDAAAWVRCGPAGLQRRAYCAPSSELMVHVDHTPNPDCLKFSPERSGPGEIALMPDGKIMELSATNVARAEQSPLVQRLFKIDGVSKVCVADTWLTVTKTDGLEWEELSPVVMESIRQWYASGEPVTTDDYSEDEDTDIDHDFDTEVVQAIKELVKTRIRPWVQQDGGNIKYIGFEDGVVLLLMQGACQSCPSSGATLKGGIEKMMMHWIPEVLEVRSVDEEFAEEFEEEMAEMKRLYKLDSNGTLVRRDSAESDDDLMNKSI
ncbi:NFU1 iron-sulfur cluster scaffold-like protein [Diplonema papillatum]|nr:NFU1 iron-sulfur cluster scaffold-like protein [Diplonema papillatum]